MILSGGIVLSAEPSEGPPSAPCSLSHALLHFPFSPSLWNDDEVSDGIRRCVQNRAVLGAEQQLLPLDGQPPLTSLPLYEMLFLPCQLLSKDHEALRNLTTFAPAGFFSLTSLSPFGLQMEAPWLHTGGHQRSGCHPLIRSLSPPPPLLWNQLCCICSGDQGSPGWRGLKQSRSDFTEHQSPWRTCWPAHCQRFGFSRSGWDLRIYISSKSPALLLNQGPHFENQPSSLIAKAREGSV